MADLETEVAVAEAAVETETDPRAQSDEPARVIAGRYEVLDVLGEGASARTLLCHDRESGDRVAVKELRTDRLESWKHYDLFEREARVLESLRHHGIPEVFDFFEEPDPDGRARLYLVQECIEGTTLAERLENGPRLSEMELAHLMLGLLDILDYLHGRNPPVFHRDIKPGNIMIRPSGAPVLIDFGGVRDGWRKPDEAGSTVIGTHGYAPPEQYLGQVSPASDLYAVGATLLHALGGRAPSEYSFDTGRIELPDNLGTSRFRHVVSSLLEPAPRDRPQSAREVVSLMLEGERNATDNPMGPSTDLAQVVLPDDHPQYIELPAAPRKSEGELNGVYRNLVPTHLNALRLTPGKGSSEPTMTDVLLYILLFLCTFGIWPIGAEMTRARKRRQHDHLFRDGTFTRGRIVGITNVQGQVRVGYEYEVNGTPYRGQTHFGNLPAVHLGAGDPIGVLYNEEKPSDSCGVFK